MWKHGRCAKIKRVTNTLAIDFKGRECNGCSQNIEYQNEKFLEVVETVTDCLYLGDRIYSGGGCEAVVTSRTRLGWLKFRDCQDLLCNDISFENQRKCIQRLCGMSNALWKRDMVRRPE